MKFIFLLILLFFSFENSKGQDFFLDSNGVTVRCDKAEFGEEGVVNEVKYTKRKKGDITIHNAGSSCTSGITSMSALFAGDKFFNSYIEHWDVSNVTSMSSMFEGAESFKGSLKYWDVSNVVSMSHMFRNARLFNGSIGEWDVSSVRTFYGMFSFSNFNNDISKWDVSSVTNFSFMFFSNKQFNQNISSWNIEKARNMSSMFENSESFNQDLSEWNISSIQNTSFMFRNAKSFTSDLSYWDTSNVSIMDGMFHNAKSFRSDLTNWCVNLIKEEPYLFSNFIDRELLPRWGTCPNIVSIERIENTEFYFNIYPNPFNNFFTVSYTLTKPVSVKINLYNILGQSIYIANKQIQSPGEYSKRIELDLQSSSSIIMIIWIDNVPFRRMLYFVK